MPTTVFMKRQAVSDIFEVIEKLQNDPELIKADMIHSEIVPDSHASLMMPGNVAAFLCFEQYFFRAGGMVPASILITQEAEEQKVTIVCPTARESFTAERADQALAHRVEKVLSKMNFVKIQEKFDI